MESSEDEASLLVVLLDTNPVLWGERAFSLSDVSSSENNLILFETLLEHLFVFLNAYLMIKHQNMISIIANHIGESKFLFPKDNQTENQHIDFSEIKNLVVAELKQLAKGEIPTNLAPTFSGALSLALCYINRISKEKLQIKPRILVLQISPDVSSQYIPVMNCIFSAQKKSIPVDTCILSNQDSSLLQQASHITGGIYLKPTQQAGLLQYLLSCYLADAYTRKYLNLPIQTRVDYRASCFCHKKVIDIGFVCSVCLSIFCQFYPICSTCGAKFALPKLPKLPVPPKKKTS